MQYWEARSAKAPTTTIDYYKTYFANNVFNYNPANYLQISVIFFKNIYCN